jgi:hypothetical protein
LGPNPIVNKTSRPIKDSLNPWTFLDFPDGKTLVLQNNHSDYRIEIEGIYVRGHEPPDILVPRGQIFLEDSKLYSFEPFVEGMSADPRELTEDPLARQSPRLDETLKPHEGKLVSIRFPKGSDGTFYGPEEAMLKEVTPHFVKLHKPDGLFDPHDMLGIPRTETIASPPRRIAGFTKSIALSFIQYEEDDEKRCPRLVLDYSHWEPEL